MTGKDRRLLRERSTLRLMIRLYCRAHHGRKGREGEELCPACAALEEYALRRIRKCPFGAGKPTCARCPVHCYAPDMRARIRDVMRYAGPRMMWRHPWLALLHLLDGRRRIKGKTG